ncbi:expressed hypothetical protein [Trichoplax adhaerens]|uniref:Retinol dehydrogenase 8 n=1 Tax=Trichoplax adhaerens TaxID=10228 RepID=B3RJC7_TRIAD|nr:expressed hypothetical protein [Trichoplax adhaerens]EDV28507.1 expressed hypothetical protein [Trichoplax adhaerens]|eukprot:XP_002107709.1 expressed hypothetical protein [Trichoplax adhaerens]
MAKVAIVTGCSSGIGLKSAITLAKDPAYKVYATMRNLAKKATLAEEAGKNLDKSLFIREMDVSSDSSVEKAVKDIIAAEGRVDVVINNAGQGLFHPNETLPMEVAESIMNCNFLGTVRVCKAVLPTMKKQRSGHIINVSSLGGCIAVPFNAVYCASKFAMDGYSEALAPELRRFNVNVSVVCPGPVSTSFVDNVKAMNQEKDLDMFEAEPETKEIIQTVFTTMFNRFSHLGQTPQDIADVIVALMKEEKPRYRVATSEGLTKYIDLKFKDSSGDDIIKLSYDNYVCGKAPTS